jgi:microcystin-dependent protein
MSKLVSTHSTIIYDFCPIGAIIAFPVAAIPAGWLECNGQAISRTTFTDLFGFIGTTYGAGDGSTTFNLPDYRGVFLRGNDNGRGYDAGRALGSEQGDEFKSHKHAFGPYVPVLTTGSSGYSFNAGSSYMDTGLTGGTETRPKNVSVVFCVKATMAMAKSASTVSTFASLTHNTHQGEAASLAANGYKKFADGTIIQWGYISGASNPNAVIFPVAFSAECYGVYMATKVSAKVYVSAGPTATGFTSTSDSSSTPIYWQAVGR